MITHFSNIYKSKNIISNFKFYSNFFVEIFGFLFSFALWQAFETLTNTMSDIRMNREDITQKLIMDIYFDDER